MVGWECTGHAISGDVVMGDTDDMSSSNSDCSTSILPTRSREGREKSSLALQLQAEGGCRQSKRIDEQDRNDK